jgi:hypothetical protein
MHALVGEPEQSGRIAGAHLQSAAAKEPYRASSPESGASVFLFGLFSK